MNRIKILIADDHSMLRHGIRMLLEREPDFEVVAEACDGEEAVMLSNKYKPDVVLIDVGMPKISGLEATRQIKAEHPNTAVLVLTIYDDEEYILEFLEAGVLGYLMKSAYGQELSNAIRLVLAGDMVFDPIIGERLVKLALRHKFSPFTEEGDELFTPREIEVLQLTGRGISNREIALELDISVRAVKGHLVSIFSKIGASSRTEAVVYAIKRGWIVPEELV